MKAENNGYLAADAPNQVRAEHRQTESNLRTELGCELREILINKRLRQRELAALLAIQQPEVSHLFNGHFNRFTIDKMVHLFDRLGWVVKFKIYPREAN